MLNTRPHMSQKLCNQFLKRIKLAKDFGAAIARRKRTLERMQQTPRRIGVHIRIHVHDGAAAFDLVALRRKLGDVHIQKTDPLAAQTRNTSDVLRIVFVNGIRADVNITVALKVEHGAQCVRVCRRIEREYAHSAILIAHRDHCVGRAKVNADVHSC